jgi:hypothetical protein
MVNSTMPGSHLRRHRDSLVGWAVVALLACLPATAIARSIAIEDFDVSIDVDPAGTLAVTERIRLRFEGQWNGIHRLIPVEYRTPQGYAYRLRTGRWNVTDAETGQALKVRRSFERNCVDLKIFVPGAADASRTIAIRYTVHRGLRFFEDHDELYWNLTGDEWPYPIRAARGQISLPRELVNVRANAFTGGYGSTERAATIRIDGVRHEASYAFEPAGESPPPPAGPHVVEVESDRPLGIREGLTVAVAWNPGLIRRPTRLERQCAWLFDNMGWILVNGGLALMPLVALAVLFFRWLRHGRDPDAGPVVVHYEPPPGLGPAEVGTLVDNRPDTRDLMSMLVDLAVKRHLTIRETSKAGWLSKARYAFDLPLARGNWDKLTESERRFLEALYDRASPEPFVNAEGGGRSSMLTVTSDDLQESFYRELPKIRSAIFDGLVADGHYAKRPDHVVVAYVTKAVVTALLLAVVVGGLRMLMPRAVGESTIPLAIGSGMFTSLLIAAFGLVMPARTRKGSEARNVIRGFQEFLSRVDAHRLETLPLTPEVFERYLPFAMALGVEKRWAKAFEGVCTQPPDWYDGQGPIDSFRALDFTDGLSSMGAVTAAAMQSAPRSSEGSGFGGSDGFSFGGFGGGGSGGGFSGGGFGGGGGSGF